MFDKRLLIPAAAGIAAIVLGTALVATGEARSNPAPMPIAQMEAALQAKGTVSDGVLSVSLDRQDIGNRHIRGVVVKPSFEVNGSMTFESLAAGRALFNGDLALRPGEVNGFIDAILANGLVFQAEHQHFYDMTPPTWFIHFRGVGDPLRLAQEVHAVIKSTSIGLPQQPPAHPKTPLSASRLKSILHGYSTETGADGVVTVFVARKNRVMLDGHVAKPDANIATNISFEPLAGGRAAAAPDFALTANEVDPVVKQMRAQGWDIGCLYNQETGESPQLFFSHQFKVGDPYTLAREIRNGLNLANDR